MECRNGVTYENNYQRAAAYFLSTCADAPKKDSRLKAYELITGIYKLFANDIDALGYKSVPDVALEPWQPQKGLEKEIKNIRGPIAKIETMINELYIVVETSDLIADGLILPKNVKLSRPLKKILILLKVLFETQDDREKLVLPTGCAAGLKELAEISRSYSSKIIAGPNGVKEYLYFSRCVFEPSSNWNAAAFDHLLGAEGRLLHLCSELEKKGYQRIDCLEGQKVGLEYVKQYGKKVEPLKLAWAERSHAGISLSYEELRLEPAFFWIRVPMFKVILEHSAELPSNVKEFIKMYTKNCDGCRYCVQTDKTHSRPLSCITVDDQKKCPLYPGFSMNWRSLPKELEDVTLDFLEAVDRLFG